MPSEKTHNLPFGEKLKKIRIEKGMTQKEAAEYIHVTPASFSAYEKGIQVPSVSVAIKIAILFNVSLDWLFGLESLGSYDPFANTASTEHVLRNFLFVVGNKNLMSLYTENEDCDFAILHVISDSLDGFLKQVNAIIKISESEAIETAMLRELMDSAFRRYSELLYKEIHNLKEKEGQ